ncbi:Sec-independent protein translocase subunit TatA [Nakamurella silvestris]|nr:Sec-independent protein translocase subunit TatA [Nakamurella silvestris]
MGSLSVWHWLIILAIFVLLFGAKKLPDAARGLGRSLRILKSEVGAMNDDKKESEEAAAAAAATAAPAPVRPIQPAAVDPIDPPQPVVQPAQVTVNGQPVDQR